MSRQEFPKKVKVAAFKRARGYCQNCGCILMVGKSHWDHILPCGLGGDNSLDNCAVLCVNCHKKKTGKQDVPQIRKADRQRARHLGAHKPKGRPMAGSRGSKWKKKMSGEVERRE